LLAVDFHRSEDYVSATGRAKEYLLSVNPVSSREEGGKILKYEKETNEASERYENETLETLERREVYSRRMTASQLRILRGKREGRS
jgi:hypothetical protein